MSKKRTPDDRTVGDDYDDPTSVGDDYAGDEPGDGARLGGAEPGDDGDRAGGDEPDGDDGRLLDRRGYLKLAGTAAAAVAAGSAGATAAEGTTRHGIAFDRVLDAVDDLGLDPSGTEPVNGRLDDALTEGTLVRFPEGDYLFDGEFEVDADRVGVLGEGDVRFVPETGYTGFLFNYDPVPDDVLIENVDVDMRADGTTTGIRLRCRSRFHIEDVEFLGRGLTDNSGQVSAFLLGITDEDGRGVLRDAVAKKGSRVDGYAGGNGRIGVWVGWTNKGTVRIEGCDFREFGNNGTYSSRTPGQVEIVDSYFLNNNASNVRIGGEGSYVENCTVEVDFEKYTGPEIEDTGSGFGMRGVQVEQGVQLEGAESIPAGAAVRDCELVARNAPNGIALVNVSPQGRSLSVENTRIRTDVDGMWAVRRGRPGAIDWREWQETPPEPHWVRLEDVSITGSASGREAVRIVGADGSVVRNCCVHQSGSSRDGINFVDSDDGVVEDSTIDVTGTEVTFENSTASTSSITREGSCPLPDPEPASSGSTSDSEETEDTTTDETDDTTDDDAPTGPDGGLELVIDGGHTSDRIAYAFATDGTVDPGPRANENDEIDGASVEGQVEGGIDSFWVTGEFTAFEVDGDAEVRLDGDPVDPAELVVEETESETEESDGETDESSDETGESDGETDESSDDTEDSPSADDGDATDDGSTDDDTTDEASDAQTLVVDGSATYDRIDYSFTVDGSVAPGDRANESDEIDGSTVTGLVEGGIDSYEVAGAFTAFEIGADAEVRLDGEPVDPDELVSTARLVEVDGSHTSDRLAYTFGTDGTVEPGDRANESDAIDGATVTGQVEGGIDSYEVTGEFTNFQTDGDPVVRVDGERVDPDALDADADDLPHELVVVGDGAEASYLVETTGAVAKRDGGWGAEAADAADGAVASGTVADDRDTFGFSGDVVRMRVDGDASLTFRR
ncbi:MULTISPECIES: hypothetical protein [Halorubrum]|uniref:Right handed beta helix region n=1 Tax=Halorubrum ruber TaxID=2982524 RepID=A0A8T8LJ30_9EURY|nr:MULTISPECIES: hypothetical protein [Halorubrum]QUO46888.1 hypothetical protein J7656_09730 [Halorubrum ruber]